MVLVRITKLSTSLIKRTLDIGADGVVIPWIETADELRNSFAFAHYPLRGKRGIGAEHGTCWGKAISEHIVESTEKVIIVPIIESVTAVSNIHGVLDVEGMDVFFLGLSTFR